MSGEVAIGQYQQGDENKIVGLLETVFDGWPHFDLSCSPIDHWRWKYEDNPLGMRAITVGKIGDKVVSCTHGFYLRAKVGEESLMAEQGTDLAVDKGYRGSGLYQKMIDFNLALNKKTHVDMDYWLSNNPVVIKNSQRNNYPQFPHAVRHMIKIRDIDLHVKMAHSENKIAKKYGYITLKTLNQSKNSLFPPNAGRPTLNFEISEITTFDSGIETFWNEVKNKYSFIIERDLNYLKWRYCDRRGGEYAIREASDRGRILGYSVLRINRYNREYPEGFIVDLLTLPDRLDVADALVRDADEYFSEKNINIVHSLAIEGHKYSRLLKRRSFFRHYVKDILFYAPLRALGGIRDFKAAPSDKLHFMWGDLDWI
jgi:hypothetical protein